MERGRLFIAPGHDHDRETELAERGEPPPDEKDRAAALGVCGAGYFRPVISS
jgi:hypothetical protein